jgi:hypothetical protein
MKKTEGRLHALKEQWITDGPSSHDWKNEESLE